MRYFKSPTHLSNIITFWIIIFYLNLFILRNNTILLFTLLMILTIMPFHAYRLYKLAQHQIDTAYAIRHTILISSSSSPSHS
ncbi:hypothetical protein JD969_03955 [Planctomycetota bacterium]|nr:hypothetical protein JD969_03955 [Planctomycetota bacterium]